MDNQFIMKAIRRDHQVPTMLQITIIAFSLILNRVAAEFYVGEYHTSVDDSGGRNPIKKTNAILHLDSNDGRMDGNYDDDDDEESNALFAARSNKRGRHAQRRQSAAKMQGRSLSAFNPLTPGGTIYLAFIFLIPLTVGKRHLGRGKSSSSSGLSKGGGGSSSGLLERLIDKVQQDQQSLYSEMGYVDGNLMLRRGWRDLRDTLAKKLRLLPWRRRLHNNNNNDEANSQNNRSRKKKKWKSWMHHRNDH